MFKTILIYICIFFKDNLIRHIFYYLKREFRGMCRYYYLLRLYYVHNKQFLMYVPVSPRKTDVAIYLNYQSKSYMLQDGPLDDSQYFNILNQILKKENSLCLKSEWERRLKNRLQDIQKNWQIFKNYLQKQLSTFTMLNMYKRNKLNRALNLNTSNKENKTDFYNHLYPKIAHFINFFSNKLGILSIEKYLEKTCSLDYQNGKIRENQANINDQSQIKNIEIEGKDMNIQEKIQKQLQLLRVELEIQEATTDKIFYQLVREKTKEMKKNIDNSKSQNNILVNKSMKLREYVNYCSDFDKHSLQWTNLISTFYNLTKKVYSKNHQFFRNIENQRLVQNQCLGCSKFFVKNQNIYQQFANRTPIKTFSSIRKLKQMQGSLKDEICRLLNSAGGIILFDCTNQYRGIYPQGTPLTQRDKQQYEQRIYSYCNQFYPKLQVKKHIHVTFVPLVTLQQPQSWLKFKKYSGQEGILKENYRFYQRNYEKGVFVVRIKVVPGEHYFVYFWHVSSKSMNQGQMRNQCHVNRPDGSSCKLNNRKILKLIKQKMSQFYVNQSFSDRDKQLLMNPSNHIEHECLEPDIGVTMGELLRDRIYKNENNLQERYNYLSMLIVNKESHSQMKQNLRKIRINFQLVFPKDEWDFKIAQNTAALYHNIKFQQLFQTINKHPNFNFKGKQAIMISVTSFLRLENRNQKNPLNEEQFKQLADKFSRKFPNETLKCFCFKNKNPRETSQYQFYLLTQTKKSTLFLFYLINQQIQQKKKRGMKQDRAVFKNPYLLDKLSQQQRQQRMKMIFERKGRNELISSYRDKRNQSKIIHLKLFQQAQPQQNILNKNQQCQFYDILEINQKQKMNNLLNTFSLKKCEFDQIDEDFQQQWQQLINQYEYFRNVCNKSQNFEDL